MAPSLFTCPTINKAVPYFFAVPSKRDVHSLTCETLPGLELIVEQFIVWIESITRTSGLYSSIALQIENTSVSEAMAIFCPLIPNLLALSLIWETDSSPLTYATVYFWDKLPQICSRRVDLPAPGSPPISIPAPFTIPPPRTLSSSLIPVRIRFLLSSASISLNWLNSTDLYEVFFAVDAGEVSITSSVIVFHSLQDEHCPCHLW